MLRPTSPQHRRFALLDRDGTIIVDKVYLADPDGLEFTKGAIEGLKLLRDAGFGLILITNQSGIARGYFDEAMLARIHARLRELLAAEEIHLDAIYHCPHGPDDGCDCRKPAPGMILAAMADFGFDAASAICIGDSAADMGAAAACGVARIRIAPEAAAGAPQPEIAKELLAEDLVAKDFLAAAHMAIDHFR